MIFLYKDPDGKLIFTSPKGSSGDGNLLLNDINDNNMTQTDYDGPTVDCHYVKLNNEQ